MKTALILVLFEPRSDNWLHSVKVALQYGYLPIVMDNSEKFRVLEDTDSDKYIYIRLGENNGIGKAQNFGLRIAMEKGADIIGFFDQDSIITSDLLYELEKTLINSNNIAIVAPASYDSVTGKEYPSHMIRENGRFVDVYTCMQQNVIPVDVAISSGTFVKRYVFEKVGLFNESLFIDFVDIEWCIRCKNNGYSINIVPSAKMFHSIGEKTKKIWMFTIDVHSPYRTYYKVRNAFLLLKCRVGFKVAFFQILPAIVLNFFLLFDKTSGKMYRKYYYQGLCDGIKQLDGKYEDIHSK